MFRYIDVFNNTAICGGIITGCIMMICCNDMLSELKIQKIVRENHDEILEAVDSGTYSDLKLQGVKSIKFADDMITMDFNCGTDGNATLCVTKTAGFYYSPSNAPYNFFGPEREIQQTKKDAWIYSEKNDRNRYYTKRICDNFFIIICAMNKFLMQQRFNGFLLNKTGCL